MRLPSYVSDWRVCGSTHTYILRIRINRYVSLIFFSQYNMSPNCQVRTTVLLRGDISGDHNLVWCVNIRGQLVFLVLRGVLDAVYFITMVP